MILDPRFKMDIIEYYYDKLHGRELSYSHVKKVRTTFFDLYIEYGGRVISAETTIADLGYEELISSNSVGNSASSQSSKLNDFKRWRLRERSVGNRYVPKSEFDQYLEEETHSTSRKFNIDIVVSQWSYRDRICNLLSSYLAGKDLPSTRFPTISKIARDVLAIPATTVLLNQLLA